MCWGPLALLDSGIPVPRTDVPVTAGSRSVYSRVLALGYQRLAHGCSDSSIVLLPGPSFLLLKNME